MHSSSSININTNHQVRAKENNCSRAQEHTASLDEVRRLESAEQREDGLELGANLRRQVRLRQAALRANKTGSSILDQIKQCVTMCCQSQRRRSYSQFHLHAT